MPFEPNAPIWSLASRWIGVREDFLLSTGGGDANTGFPNKLVSFLIVILLHSTFSL